MTPREKILRDGIAEMRAYVAPGHGVRAFIDRILAAAGAIPDAPVADQSLAGVYQVSAIATKPIPSREELIELMCVALEFGEGYVSSMHRVLDALIKAGAVRT